MGKFCQEYSPYNKNKEKLSIDVIRLKNMKQTQKKVISILFSATSVVMFSSSAIAQNLFVYPARGQSATQQQRDEAECRTWAQQQTGFNPAQPPTQIQTGSNPEGKIIGGAARGAALGAVGGLIGGNTGRGAAIGAGVGATDGLFKHIGGNRETNAAQQQVDQQWQQNMNAFNNAFSVCLEGRGYTVR